MAKNQYNGERVSYLAHEILRHKRLYYAGKPEISDHDYDKLEGELALLAPDHPVLTMVGSFEEEKNNLLKVAHEKPMLSLEKTYDMKDLLDWSENRELVATYKLDGNCLSIIYKNGVFESAKTRGNGRLGEDVTSKIKWVSDCVPILNEHESEIEVRGELCCTDAHFVRLLQEMEILGLEKATNQRNIVAGLLGRKQYGELARFCSFYAFDVSFKDQEDKFTTEAEKMSWLEAKGFPIPYWKLVSSKEAIHSFIEEAKDFWVNGDFGIDGVVFTFNDVSLHKKLGSTAHHPRYRIAFKWQGETAVTKINNIIWSTSRLGIVTPVAQVEPVFLSGAKISNVTLHNAAYVKGFNLKSQDVIEIVRSGEVIPKFLRVETSTPGVYEFPKLCPSCEAELLFDEVRLVCPNASHCPAQQMGAILNWIKSVKLEDLSEKRLEQLVQKGLVQHVSDLYRLTQEDLLTLPLTKEKMAQKLLRNIEKAKTVLVVQFLNGLGISGLGITTWEELLSHFKDLKTLQEASVGDILDLHGFAEKTAAQIVQGLAKKKSDIKKLFEAGVSIFYDEEEGDSSGDKPLKDKVFVITGTLSRPRSHIEKEIKKAGGKVSSSVSSSTFAVITEDHDSNSSKTKKARELGIPFWTEEDLARAIKG